MAWSQLDITKPHLVYIILGGFTSLFMLCSSVIKERMYIGEATVATLCGVIFGPHVADLINPNQWGDRDIVTVEFSRIVLVVQCFAVGVELPKYYMERHWKSVVFLLVPVMTAGWLLVSLFVWWMIPGLDWLDSLVVAACVTATDPVLASSVVGKGKFAKRVPKHLRDLLSAESGCNDGMAFPFIYLSLYLIQYKLGASEVSFHFVVYIVLYECVFGAFYGFMVGYIARHGIKLAHERDLIDRESFLVFYFVIALFCAGSGSILGVDDLLVGFSAGVGFSNDGWFGEKTEESSVSNVIDLLLNLTYFVYFGTIIPWEEYNSGVEGLKAWRLVVIAIFVLFFRRIPIMMLLRPIIPDVKNWREGLFAGHFGPIGVGAIFVAMLARAELEHGEPVPTSTLPPKDHPHYKLLYLVWPIVTFLVISSILIHGSSVAVFTLGKRINTLSLTMSYTMAADDGPSWMNRLPRISSQSRSQAKTMSDTSLDDVDKPQLPPDTLAPPGQFLRRQRDESPSRPNSRASSLMSRRRKHKKWDDGTGPGGPVSQSAIFPSRASQTPVSPTSPNSEKQPEEGDQVTTESTLEEDSPSEKIPEQHEDQSDDSDRRNKDHLAPPSHVNLYEEGRHIIVENDEGDVVDQKDLPSHREATQPTRPKPTMTRRRSKSEPESSGRFGGIRKRMTDMYNVEVEKRKDKDKSARRHEPARAYQFGNTIIVENEDGEVVKSYELPSAKGESQGSQIGNKLRNFGFGGLSRQADKSPESAAEEGQASTGNEKLPHLVTWAGLGVQRAEHARKKTLAQQEAAVDDRKIRFTIGDVGQRMTKEDFIKEMQKLDAGTRKDVVDRSTASSAVKRMAKEGPRDAAAASGGSSRPPIPRIVEHGTSSSSRSSRARVGRLRSSSGSSDGHAEDSSSSTRSPPLHSPQPSEKQSETAIERRRRLAVLESQMDEGDASETPAERRRREAALGMGTPSRAEDSDSDDEGEPRVPLARRGIRFAAEPSRGRE